MELVKFRLAGIILAALCCAPMTAQAGLFDDDEARKAILDLRGRIDALRRDTRLDLDAKADKSGALDLANKNEELRQEIAKLRGQIEVLANEVSNAQQRQKDFYVDLDTRLRKMEPRKVTIDGREADVDPTEQKMYDAALAFFKAGDYRNTTAALLEFMRRYPQSGYAATAHYWLGSAYYAQRDYRNAIASQQTVVNSFPDSPKASDALLNIASCYTDLKDKASAKKALEALLDKYPDSPAAQTGKERLATFR